MAKFSIAPVYIATNHPIHRAITIFLAPNDWILSESFSALAADSDSVGHNYQCVISDRIRREIFQHSGG